MLIDNQLIIPITVIKSELLLKIIPEFSLYFCLLINIMNFKVSVPTILIFPLAKTFVELYLEISFGVRALNVFKVMQDEQQNLFFPCSVILPSGKFY